MARSSIIAIAELRAQAVAKEVERKQNLMRLKWFEENYEKIYKNPALPKDKIPKKSAKLYEELRQMRKERFKADRELKMKQLPVVEDTEDIVTIFSTMFPVPEEVRSVLYEGVSHDEEGRYKYLQLRTKKAPYLKYRQKETSAFEYGWLMHETAPIPKKDHFRRTTWFRRMNGALKFDDPVRRPPNPAGHISFPSL